MLLHAWVTVYADSHYSAADSEAGIELQDAEPARPPGARDRPRGRGRGRRPLANPAVVSGPASNTRGKARARARAAAAAAAAALAAQT